MSWIQTSSGRAFDFVAAMNGQPQPIDLMDIGYALAGIFRFTGHTRVTVAEHSVMVAKLAAERAAVDGFDADLVACCGLFHDAHEAYTGDVSRPLKIFLRGQGIEIVRDLERAVQEQIEGMFCPEFPQWARDYVKLADDECLAVEKEQILGEGPREREWEWLPPVPPGLVVQQLAPDDAEHLFMSTVHTILHKLELAEMAAADGGA